MNRLARTIRDSPEVQAHLAAELQRIAGQMEEDRPLVEEFRRAATRLQHRIDFDRRFWGLGQP